MSFNFMKTYSQKKGEVSCQWYLIDASTLALGRVATEIAKLLIGKHKPTYTPHINNGDGVIVINSDQLVVTGNKKEEKFYYSHSGHLGNLRQWSLAQQMEKDSREVIYKAVQGMLPKNKLRQERLKRLRVYKTGEHSQEAQQPRTLALSKGKTNLKQK